MRKAYLNDRIAVVLIFVIACGFALPVAFLGIPDSFDLTQHIRFANTWLNSFLDGQLIPSWAANDNFGLGSVGIRFYPPLAYIVLALTHLLTGNWYDAFWVDALGWMFLGCIGVYFWAREWVTEPYALLAALIYALIPYRTFELYQAVLFAEFAAAGILPFCFLFLTRTCRKRDLSNTLLLAASVSLLMLAHIPSTLIGLACLSVYALLIVGWRDPFSILLRLGFAGVIAFAGAGFHWVKLVSEINWVKHNSPLYFGTGYYDFNRYFFPLYFITPTTRYFEKALWEDDAVIGITILFFLPSLIFVLWRLKSSLKRTSVRRPDLALLATGIFSIFMLSLASSWIWQHAPVLYKIQFPWRWLLAATATAPLCFVLFLSRMNKIRPGRALIYPAVALILVASLYSVTQNMTQSNPLERPVFDKLVSGMDDSEACACWWPVWGGRKALDQHDKVEAGERPVEIGHWSASDRSFTIGEGKAGDATIATFWYPFWKATINGSAVEAVPNENGSISIPLSNERSEVHVYFREPAMVTAANYVSIFTWFAIIAALSFNWRKKKNA